MKEIRTEEAVGHVLCHDITQIIKDEKNGVLFKKGPCSKRRGYTGASVSGKRASFCMGKNRRESFTKTKGRRFCMKSAPADICTEQR